MGQSCSTPTKELREQEAKEEAIKTMNERVAAAEKEKEEQVALAQENFSIVDSEDSVY